MSEKIEKSIFEYLSKVQNKFERFFSKTSDGDI